MANKNDINQVKALTVEYYLDNKEVHPRNSFIDMIKEGSIVQIHSTEWKKGKDMKRIDKITYREEDGDLVVRVHLKNS